MEVEFARFAGVTGMQVPTHNCRAAMSDGPSGAALCRVHRATVVTPMNGQKAAQRINDGDGHGVAPVAASFNAAIARRVVPPKHGCPAPCDE